MRLMAKQSFAHLTDVFLCPASVFGGKFGRGITSHTGGVTSKGGLVTTEGMGLSTGA